MAGRKAIPKRLISCNSTDAALRWLGNVVRGEPEVIGVELELEFSYGLFCSLARGTMPSPSTRWPVERTYEFGRIKGKVLERAWLVGRPAVAIQITETEDGSFVGAYLLLDLCALVIGLTKES
jgi:hypothetical protein